MRRIRKILAATGFSERALRAESRAAMLSIALKCETLEIMAVKNPRARTWMSMTEDVSHADENTSVLLMQREANAVVHDSPQRVRPTCIRSVRFGKPAPEILARADELPADLIVVGAHGGNFLTDFFLGYDTGALVRMSKRPLLFVKNQPQGPYTKVIVAVDFSDESREAARTALEIAPAAQVTFLHAFQVAFEGQMREVGVSENIIQGYRAKAAEKARQRLDQFIAELGPRRQLLTRAVHHGFPVPVIGRYIKDMNPDLIAMGKHGRSRIGELILGSATRRMLEQTPGDLLITTAAQPADEWFEPPAA